MRYRECTADRRGNRYIEGKERQARTYQVRKVRDQALPDHSHETNETSGVDLTQKERRSNELRVRNGCGCWECVSETQGNQRV